MELKEVSLQQLQNKSVIGLSGQALEYFRNVERAKNEVREKQTRYDFLTDRENFTAETAVIFSREGNRTRDEVYRQLMFIANDDVVEASTILYKLVYGLINFISLDR